VKVIIAGSRDINDLSLVEEAVEEATFPVTEIVSGTARGVDRLGEQYGLDNDIAVKKFPADWNKHGRSAGHIRNAEMAQYADGLIAIWDGKSRGTKSMIDIARNAGLWVSVKEIK